MTADQGFVLHLEAALDITEIWEFIAKDNPLAAKRVREDILDTVRKLVSFPIRAQATQSHLTSSTFSIVELPYRLCSG